MTAGFKETPIGRIPEDWEVVRLGDISVDIQQGFASGKRDENGIIQLRMNNITTDGRVVLDSYIKVPILKEIDRYLLKPGDILFKNTNSVDLIGKTAIFRGECEYCTYSNHITRIRVDKKEQFQNGYSMCSTNYGRLGIFAKYVLDM